MRTVREATEPVFAFTGARDGLFCVLGGHVNERKTFQLAEFKADDDDGNGSFEGRASTFGEIDSYGDVVDSGAYAETIPEFLERGFVGWGHDWTDPIGYFVDAKERSDGLFVKGVFHGDAESQRKRAIVQERAAAGKFIGLSIGFQPIEWQMREVDERTVRALTKIKLFEVSLVTVPAERNSHVTSVKEALEDELPALWQRSIARIEAVLASDPTTLAPTEREQIRALNAALEEAQPRLARWLAGEQQQQMPDLSHVDPVLLREIERFRELSAKYPWRTVA
jgi:HK97 family phage prohead protease